MPDNKSIADPTAEIAERALKKTSIVNLDGLSGPEQRYLFVAPYDCRIDEVSLLSDTAVQANDSNYYSIQVRNLTPVGGPAVIAPQDADIGRRGD